jgi:glycosyltransferase involved in cell wall biosynthesis
MKICLYSPYVPKHLGGGEKHFFDVARIVAKRYPILVAISQDEFANQTKEDIKAKYEAFLGEKLDNVDFIASPLGTSSSPVKKFLWTKQFDILYYVTDGSLFFSLAKKNILHIQLPIKLDKSSFIEKIKLANWQIKNTNSKFTKKIIEDSWPTKIDLVHQPMVNVAKLQDQNIDLAKKQQIILNVGRFFRQLHNKKQHVLVDIFKKLVEKYPAESKDWKLVLIGSVEDKSYAKEVADQAKGLPIEIRHQVTRKQLDSWYKKSSIYWHATGFGIDEMESPEKQEHFGITTVEAMALGCCPVVIGQAGQLEVLANELLDLTWKTEQGCIHNTLQMMLDKTKRKKMQQMAMKRAQAFDGKMFENKIWQMFKK